MIQVNPCAEGEWPGALSLALNVFAGEGYVAASAAPFYTRETLESAGLVLTACEGGVVFGVVMLLAHGSPLSQVAREGEAEIRMLAVDPACRGRGMGEKLVEECVARAGRPPFSARGVALFTQPKMLAAQRLYERMGFARAPERDLRRPPLAEKPEIQLERWAYVRPL